MGEIQTTDTGQALALHLTGSTELEVARRKEFAAIMVPCLTLVSGATHTREARREWLAAADIALGDARMDHLAIAAKSAMQGCDHPSKIVPAIRVKLDQLEARARSEQNSDRVDRETRALLDRHRTPLPDAVEVGQLMKDLVKRMEASS